MLLTFCKKINKKIVDKLILKLEYPKELFMLVVLERMATSRLIETGPT